MNVEPTAVLWTLDDWATAVLALPVEGVLPRRTVVVPNERVAHALRRRLIERGERAALVGTRFLSLLQLAREVLRSAGEEAAITDPELARLLTREAIARSALEYFQVEQLLDTPGWDEAIARTLTELEAAELEPGALLQSRERHVRDVGRVFERLMSERRVVTSATLLRRAAARAPAGLALGSVLAVVTGFESAAEARLLRALPGVRVVRWTVRPRRPQHDERLALLFGAGARGAIPDEREVEAQTQLEGVQSSLFTERRATARADGTVRVVTYAGLVEEVEAAVAWVVEQVMSGVAAQEVAILAPQLEAYGPLLRARLRSLPWAGEDANVYSERGLPVVERADGQRVLLVVRALAEGLSRDALSPLLPLLRPRDADALGIRGASRAWEVINAVAYAGGERSHLEGGLVWSDAWRRAIERLERAPVVTGGLEERESARRDALRTDLEQLLPAICALTSALRQVVEGRPLGVLASSLVELVRAHVKLPPATPPAWALFTTALGTDEASAPHGPAALTFLERLLVDAAIQDGRFGSPRVYVGTFVGVRGLSFRAVRLVGLVEGAVPSAVREDAVLPDAERVSLSPLLLTSRQRAHRQMAAFDDAVRCARETLVLSAPRVSAERSSRQPAAVFLDVIRALRRAESGRGLERELEEAAREGREKEREVRHRLAVSASARLERIARGDRDLSPSAESPALSLAVLRAVRDRIAPGTQDGLLPSVFAPESLPGLTGERPISASRLQTLLACPHQFLYESLLGFYKPEEPLPTDVLPLNIFGTWLHGIAELFWREHGDAIANRAGELAQHREVLRSLAVERFGELRATYPFANEVVANAERDAICDQLDKLLTYDWGARGQRSFVDVERGFGFAEPCTLSTSAGTLYVRGKIDKLDSEDGALLVRDIKTGTGRPRRGEAPPELGIDLQLGVYAQVARALASSWGTPTKVAVAYLYLRRGELERSWRDGDYALLERHTREWLATAVDTLRSGAFVRTLDRNDCRFCPHQAVCASELEHAEPAMDDPRVPRRLRDLKRGAPQ